MAEITLFVAVGSVCLAIGIFRDKIGQAFSLMDLPDGIRKLHGRPTPVVGGLMFMACALAMTGTGYVSMTVVNQRFVVVAALVISHGILGITDDRYPVLPAARLAYSLALTSAVLAVDRSMIVRDIYFSWGYSLRLGSMWEYALTVLFVVGCIYAVNMIDGLNGLLALYCLIVTGFFAVWLFRNFEGYFCAVVITLGIFMAFNMAGALFAGDGGSYLVGSGAAVVLLHLYDRSSHSHTFPIDLVAVPVLVPIADALRVSISRLLRGKGVFVADRNHLHHRLVDKLGYWPALGCYSVTSAVPVVVAILIPQNAWFALSLGLAFYVGTVIAIR